MCVIEARIQDCIAQLSRSGRGVNAIVGILRWLEDDGLGLDAANQDAVIALLRCTWGPKTGTTLDAMREAIHGRERESSKG